MVLCIDLSVHRRLWLMLTARIGANEYLQGMKYNFTTESALLRNPQKISETMLFRPKESSALWQALLPIADSQKNLVQSHEEAKIIVLWPLPGGLLLICLDH